jgi:SEC-C motif domain protein
MNARSTNRGRLAAEERGHQERVLCLTEHGARIPDVAPQPARVRALVVPGLTNPAQLAECPCGLPASYAECCGRWHSGELRLRAPDAEHLMRSRYSAYVLQDMRYLLDTWHPRTRPAQLDAPSPQLRWLGLEVRRYAQHDDHHATVEFIARYKQGGRATRLHEISSFEMIEGRWYYIEPLPAWPSTVTG